jgi:hypothetical protein
MARVVAVMRIDRATGREVRSILAALPGAGFDRARSEIRFVEELEAGDEPAAVDQVIRFLRAVIEDVGLSPGDYRIGASVTTGRDEG